MTGFDSELAEELEQLEYYSFGDYVEVQITDVERAKDNTATVTFDPPVGDAFAIDMEVPLHPSTDTQFTRLLRETGRNFGNASEMIGDRVPAEYTEDGWVIEYTEPTYTLRERVSRKWRDGLSKADLLTGGLITVALGAFIYWPVTGLPVSLGIWMAGGDEDTEDPPFMVVPVTYVVGFGLWAIVSWVVNLIAAALGFQFPIEVTLLL